MARPNGCMSTSLRSFADRYRSAIPGIHSAGRIAGSICDISTVRPTATDHISYEQRYGGVVMSVLYRTSDAPAEARGDYWRQVVARLPVRLEGEPSPGAAFRAEVVAG